MGPAVIVLDLTTDDVLQGIRCDDFECPVARALRRGWPAGRWMVECSGVYNEAYGTYWLRERVGDDGGAMDLARYDGGAPLTRRRFVYVREG